MTTLPIGDLTSSFAGMGSKIIFWVGYSLLGLIMLGVMVMIFLYLQYTIKVDVYQLYGSGKSGQFSIGKKKKNRVKWIKKRTAWKPLWPMMNKKEIEPFDSEYMYPGKQIMVFESNNEWTPIRLNIEKDGKGFKGELNPVPYYVRNWQSIQHKKHANEFAEHNFWEDNKYFFMVVMTAGLCLVMVGLTVYFTYKFASGGNAAMSGLADAMRNFNTIGGVGPT